MGSVIPRHREAEKPRKQQCRDRLRAGGRLAAGLPNVIGCLSDPTIRRLRREFQNKNTAWPGGQPGPANRENPS
jgi:hypothetical protein